MATVKNILYDMNHGMFGGDKILVLQGDGYVYDPIYPDKIEFFYRTPLYRRIMNKKVIDTTLNGDVYYVRFK